MSDIGLAWDGKRWFAIWTDRRMATGIFDQNSDIYMGLLYMRITFHSDWHLANSPPRSKPHFPQRKRVVAVKIGVRRPVL
jgi:hypothetical protein